LNQGSRHSVGQLVNRLIFYAPATPAATKSGQIEFTLSNANGFLDRANVENKRTWCGDAAPPEWIGTKVYFPCCYRSGFVALSVVNGSLA
jgi:hypothetical protein